jgi:hypothetical protein
MKNIVSETTLPQCDVEALFCLGNEAYLKITYKVLRKYLSIEDAWITVQTTPFTTKTKVTEGHNETIHRTRTTSRT